MSEVGLLYESDSALLRRCFFDVQNEVGPGRQERAYQRACEIWLTEHDVPFRSHPPLHLTWNTRVVHTLYPDLVVWDRITVELKALRRELREAEFAQVFDYLKYRGDRLGMLANLGLDRVAVERLCYDAKPSRVSEDWSEWRGRVCGENRVIGRKIQTVFRQLAAEIGCGYGQEVWAKLVHAACADAGLAVAVNPIGKADYRGQQVDEAPLDCLLVESRLVLVWSALFPNNRSNIRRGLSFMQALDRPLGLAVNFGKTLTEFTALQTR